MLVLSRDLGQSVVFLLTREQVERLACRMQASGVDEVQINVAVARVNAGVDGGRRRVDLAINCPSEIKVLRREVLNVGGDQHQRKASPERA